MLVRRLTAVLAILLSGGALTGAQRAAAAPLAPIPRLRPGFSLPAAAPLPPQQDPFYRYTGATPLAQIPPGTVLKTRSVQVALGSTQTPVRAEQLLYRTSGELGTPTVTVTTVLLPATATVAPRIVDYLSFYDALGAQCDPSYTLAGGNPGAANEQQTQVEEGLILEYLADDFIVTVPDFEGTNLDWTAGYEAGYDSLDALRATESYLHLPRSTEAGLSGYSGGSIAADWASELAPSYAPELNIVGVAEGGIPVDYAHNLDYINGSAGWSGIIPAAIVGLTRAYRVDLAPYLSAYGAKLVAAVQHACIGSFYGAYPGLTVQQLLKPQYQDVFKIPVFVRIINDLIMGSVPGHPKGPLFMAVGNADGTGDGVMVTADVEALAHEYCQQGVPVSFTVYSGANHDEAALRFEPAAVSFLAARFAGLPFTSNCSSVGPGNSLAPLPMPASGQAPTHSPSASHQSQQAAAKPGGSLAFTGLRPAVPLAGVILLALALALCGFGLLARRRVLLEDVHRPGGDDRHREQRNE
ncbi:MAG: lipase family protein [Mycobacteriales bacterium]